MLPNYGDFKPFTITVITFLRFRYGNGFETSGAEPSDWLQTVDESSVDWTTQERRN
jgi:hypothetical protein